MKFFVNDILVTITLKVFNVAGCLWNLIYAPFDENIKIYNKEVFANDTNEISWKEFTESQNERCKDKFEP